MIPNQPTDKPLKYGVSNMSEQHEPEMTQEEKDAQEWMNASLGKTTATNELRSCNCAEFERLLKLATEALTEIWLEHKDARHKQLTYGGYEDLTCDKKSYTKPGSLSGKK